MCLTRRRKEDIRRELNMYSMTNQIKEGEIKWRQYIEIENTRLLGIISYRPRRREYIRK